MDVVSSIRREGNLVEILFNDSRKLCLSSKIFRAHRVSEGDTLDLHSYLPQIADAQRKEALQKAVSLIAVKDRSVEELRAALDRRHYRKPIVDYVLQRLTAEGLLSDSAFALSFVRQRMSQGLGSQRILLDLRRKGVAGDTAEAALAAAGYAEQAAEQARRAALRYAKRYAVLDVIALQKIKMALLRKGYHMDVAAAALRGLDRDESI